MSEQADRPSLVRRRPRAASDENVDPVNYVQPQPMPTPAAAADSASTRQPAAASDANEGGFRTHPSVLTAPQRPEQPAPATTPAVTDAPRAEPLIHRGPGPRRRETTVQLGVRVAEDVSNLIYQLAAEDGTARAVVENAVRAYAAQQGQRAHE